MNGTYTGYSPLDGMDLNILETVDEVDDNFEPLTRARSNTWPLPRPENYVDPPEDGTSQIAGTAAGTPGLTTSGTAGNKCSVRVPMPGLPTKKNSSRRNAWGNLSYADLITQAINSSPDHRLTLSQIYEWMVQNVNYFKDKGDSNSSAGWKNSIRHNLSLHSRFMRVQNEGTGKSSWWMIDPDAKPGKSVRRRAASMETSKYEKRRGRAKKKVEVLRNGSLPDQPISPSSSVSESADHFPDSPRHSSGGFQLSPESRPRAYSNPSVFSGGGFQLSADFRGRTSSQSSAARLTPIQSVGVENEWATGFNNGNFNGADMVNGTAGAPTSGNYSAADQLAGNLAQGMKIQSESFLGYVNEQNAQNQSGTPFNSSLFNEQFQNRDFHSMQSNSPNVCGIHRMQQCNCLTACIKVERMSPPYPDQSPDPMATQQYMTGAGRIPHRPQSASPPLSNQTQEAPSTMMGQYIGALSVSDDLNINVDSLQGGFDCNVDDIIQHELNTEGCLDFNFTSQQQALAQQANESAIGIHHHTVPTAVTVAYQHSPSGSPSWDS